MEMTTENYRAYVFLEWQRGQFSTQIYNQLIETQREDVPARATVFRWCRNFTDKTRTTIFDLPRSGRPSTSISAYNIRIIKELLKSSPKQSLRTLAGEINCGNDSVRKILVEELQLRKVCSVWIPHELSQANKQSHYFSDSPSMLNDGVKITFYRKRSTYLE